MMDCFVVWAADRNGNRWVDSIFIARESADDRVAQLTASLKSAGLPVALDRWWCWAMSAKLEDAVPGVPKDSSNGKDQKTKNAPNKTAA